MDASKTFAKTAGKKILKETAKATGYLIGNKIAERLQQNHIIRYISTKERQKIIDELKHA